MPLTSISKLARVAAVWMITGKPISVAKLSDAFCGGVLHHTLAQPMSQRWFADPKTAGLQGICCSSLQVQVALTKHTDSSVSLHPNSCASDAGTFVIATVLLIVIEKRQKWQWVLTHYEVCIHAKQARNCIAVMQFHCQHRDQHQQISPPLCMHQQLNVCQ